MTGIHCTYSESRRRSAATISAGRALCAAHAGRSGSDRVALKVPLIDPIRSNLTPKHDPDLEPPLRNRTVDLLLTIGTARRPERTSWTDCTRKCTESTERTQCARHPVHDPVHVPAAWPGRSVTLSDPRAGMTVHAPPARATVRRVPPHRAGTTAGTWPRRDDGAYILTEPPRTRRHTRPSGAGPRWASPRAQPPEQASPAAPRASSAIPVRPLRKQAHGCRRRRVMVSSSFETLFRRLIGGRL